MHVFHLLPNHFTARSIRARGLMKTINNLPPCHETTKYLHRLRLTEGGKKL